MAAAVSEVGEGGKSPKPGFSRFGTPPAIRLASRAAARTQVQTRGIEMNRNHAFGNRLAAALSAFALSLVMISGTVSVPAKAAASAQAYVGEIA